MIRFELLWAITPPPPKKKDESGGGGGGTCPPPANIVVEFVLDFVFMRLYRFPPPRQNVMFSLLFLFVCLFVCFCACQLLCLFVSSVNPGSAPDYWPSHHVTCKHEVHVRILRLPCDVLFTISHDYTKPSWLWIIEGCSSIPPPKKKKMVHVRVWLQVLRFIISWLLCMCTMPIYILSFVTTTRVWTWRRASCPSI